MSYCIDGETPYWGGLSIPCKEREYPDAWDWVLKELTRTLEESRKVSKEWDEMANKLRNKLEQMEMEKKKNGMTRAEAFEWLKCKKVDTVGLGKEVQKKLFECGVRWANGKSEYYDFSDYLLIEDDGELYHCGNCGDAYWRAHHFEEIYAHDILSLEIEEECAKDGDGEYGATKISLLGSQICEILRQMNGHYHVEITEDDVHLFPEGTNLYHSDPF